MSDDAGPNPLIPLDLLAAGDPRFVAALRGVADSAALAGFAAPWFADARPEARRLLCAYLDESPNAPGHEGLIKRLFKLAEGAGDDEVMARFLVLGDRLILRQRRVGRPVLIRYFATPEAAQEREAKWITKGWRVERTVWPLHRLFGMAAHRVRADRRSVMVASTRETTLPRPDWREGEALANLTAAERAGRRWFSVATRRHLQRRAWRYFRHLGRTDPDRYLAAAGIALGLYRDAELGDGFALLDHCGLMHLLFEWSPTLRFKSSGCDLAIGHTLAELTPDPAFPAIWADRPEAVWRVLTETRATVVARWAVRRIEADRERFRDVGTAAGWVDLLERDDPEVASLALTMLNAAEITPARWVEAMERVAPANRGVVGAVVERSVRADEVSRADAVRLALSDDETLARLGWGWVEGQGMEPRAGDDAEGDARELLRLVDAGCQPLRPVLLRTVRAGLAGRGKGRVDWVWAMLASRYADARAEGWAWFRSEPSLRDDPGLWARVAGSPYPDVQAACATVDGPVPVEARRLDEVWAAVLLTPGGMARLKPGVIRRVVARLDAIGDEAGDEVDGLLGLLATVARSSRGPERRAALAALIGLVERRPGWLGRVEALVPALQIAGGPAIVPASGS